jgi:hypothetical protein
MIHRLAVDVHVPRACYDALGDSHAFQAWLRQAGVLPAQAAAVRWRLDPDTAGSIVSYSVPVPLPAPARETRAPQ